MAGLLLTAAAACAQTKETLGTKVSAVGLRVTLDWDKKHPWDPELMAHGTTLMAEYETKTHGIVNEQMGKAMPLGGAEREIRIQLPNSVLASPIGGVCLYFKLDSGKVLPIRRSDGKGSDTARFRYEAWEQPVVLNAHATGKQGQVEATKRLLAGKQAEIAAAQAGLDRMGWAESKGCSAVSGKQLYSTERPFDVIDPAQHEEVARRVCTGRLAYGAEVRLTRIAEFRHLSEAEQQQNTERMVHLVTRIAQEPSVAGVLMKLWRQNGDVRDPNFVARSLQFDQMQLDWSRWSAADKRYKLPPLGAADDTLGIQSEAAEVGEGMFPLVLDAILHHSATESASVRDIAGFVGGTLEAYSRCVVDAQKQLRTKYDSWRELQARAPELNRSKDAQMTAACERDLTFITALRAQEASLKAQLTQDEAALAADQTGRQRMAGTDAPIVLNGVACSVR